MRQNLRSAFLLITLGIMISGIAVAEQPSSQPDQAAGSSSASTLKTQKDKASYAIGAYFGRNLKRDEMEISPEIFLRGMRDAMSGGKLLLTDAEIKATLTKLQQEARDKREARMKKLSEENAKKGAAFLAANKTKEGVVTLPSGLQYKVLKQGDGPKPTLHDMVTCNYRGTLVDGTEFDSSYKRGQPATFPVSGVIKGWTEILQKMPVGSKYEVYIPAGLAYGQRGPGNIGPNSTLVFDIELLSIKEGSMPAMPPGHPQKSHP